MPQYLRLNRVDRADIATAEPGTPIPFAAATPGKKRDGVNTAGLPWRSTNYDKNPVVTWVHDFVGNRLPIGRGAAKITGEGASEAIDTEIVFDVADPFAAEIDRKYRAGFLHAISVSWDDIDEDGVPVRASGKKPVAHELLEIAAVPVPGDPDALIQRQARSMRATLAALEGLDDEGVTEDDAAPAARAVITPDQQRAIEGTYEEKTERIRDGIKSAGLFGDTWVWIMGTTDEFVIVCSYPDDAPAKYYRVDYTDSDGVIEIGAFTPVKITQSFTEVTPGQRAQDDEDSAWTDVAAEMVAVFDRGSDDSDDVRSRAYKALCVSYRHLGKTPPEFVPAVELQMLDDTNWRHLFLSGELDTPQARVGKELSSRNAQEFEDALAEIQSGTKRIRTVLDRVQVASTAKDGGGDGEGDTSRSLAQLSDLLTRLTAPQETGQEN